MKRGLSYLRCDRGSIAIMSAFLIPILIAVGLGGLDMYKAYNSRQNMQFIADSAALSAMKDIASSDPEVAAELYVKDLFKQEAFADQGIEIKKLEVNYETGTTEINVSLQISVATPFMSIVGVNQLNYVVSSIAASECVPYAFQPVGHAKPAPNDANEYVMTIEENNQQSAIWIKEKIDLTKLQIVNLRLYFGTKDDNGADGMTFVIHNDIDFEGVDFNTTNPQIISALADGSRLDGDYGEALGVAIHPRTFGAGGELEMSILSPALVVEFDTWKNGRQKDPGEDHTSIFLLGDTSRNESKYTEENSYVRHGGPNELGSLKSLGNIEDGQYHYARFIWDPNTGVAGQGRVLYFFDGEKVTEASVDLTRFLGADQAFWGFTGGTGSKNNHQRLCFVKTRVL